jgi:hypothetical protein
MRALSRRQKTGKLGLLVSALLFPVTLHYFSPGLVPKGHGWGYRWEAI